MSPSLTEEIRQSRPFKSLEEEVFVTLARTADLVLRPFEDLLKSEGLSPSQYNVLRILRGAGVVGLACREIGERMVSRDPDLTRLLDRLERRGLILRHREPRDRRVVVTRISQEGLLLLDRLDEPATLCQRKTFAHLGEEALKALIRLLDEVRAVPKGPSSG